ncbi:MAG: indolepyruvate ferredoxin oxidoreductase subunit alpha [Candidatus Hodarchaeota archaeon]
MMIKIDLCIGCGQCVIVCPVQAIELKDNKAIINQDLCVECGVCHRDAECPVKAIRSTRLKWPRIIRSPFSSVMTPHKITGIPGRGTEEMKTNDVTNRYDLDEIGISIDIGRPGVGTYLRNIELFTTKLSKIGVEYEKKNPVTALIIDDKGHIRDDIKNEKVLSACIEFKIPYSKITAVLKIIREVENKIDTVFSVGIISRVMENGDIPIISVLSKEGFTVRPNVKANLGLGKA